MKKYRLTTPRTIMIGIFIIGGLIDFYNHGYNSMSSIELIFRIILLLTLVFLVVIKVREFSRRSVIKSLKEK